MNPNELDLVDSVQTNCKSAEEKHLKRLDVFIPAGLWTNGLIGASLCHKSTDKPFSYCVVRLFCRLSRQQTH